MISDDLLGQRTRRLENLEALIKEGISPYPSKAIKKQANKTIIDDFSKFAKKKTTLAGRLVSWRSHGKMIFGDLMDHSGKIQLWLKKDLLEQKPKKEINWDLLKYLDVGDFIQVTGQVVKTSSGQVSLLVNDIVLLSKSLRPIPWQLTDSEELLRRRYLDLNINPEKKQLFERKAKFWQAQRQFLQEKGFIEVETPILEHVTGGADAKPFITHHNDLNQELYLRISTELFQKRLIGAGFEKVYTFGPNFRNEGGSIEHLQEYYQVEWYMAYANFSDNMRLVKEMFEYVARYVYGKTRFKSRGFEFNLASAWPTIDYVKIIKEKLDIDIFKSSDKTILDVLKNNKIVLKGQLNRNRLIDNLWKVIRKTIAGPAFLINEPKFMSPLAKSIEENPDLTERFHVIIAGSELGNGYTEINDPQDQLNRFIEQQKLREKGDAEAQMLDLDYVEMLEYGMPPTSGYGQSERIFWALEDISAREGTLFPQMGYNIDSTTTKIYGPDVVKHTKKAQTI